MLKYLKKLSDIQEFDIQMIQLLQLRNARKKELNNLNDIKMDLERKTLNKEGEVLQLKKEIRMAEGELKDINEKVQKLDKQQHNIKKVEEFNALTQEMSQAKKEIFIKEQRLSDLYEKLAEAEKLHKAFQETLSETKEKSKTVEAEIYESIDKINAEGRELKIQRDELVKECDPEIFRVYERLLRNKKDRVLVPIENRCCSGCHIMLTAQDENLVRKGERIAFCEHCSRILFWPEREEAEGVEAPVKRRRRPKIAI